MPLTELVNLACFGRTMQPGDSSLQEEVNKLREQVNEFKRQQQVRT